MICNYCSHALTIHIGTYDSAENSPDVSFWLCENCGHTHMDENQEKELKDNLERLKK